MFPAAAGAGLSPARWHGPRATTERGLNTECRGHPCGDELVQPDAGGFGVLLVRYGQPPGYLTLAGLARNRATPASSRNCF